MLDFDYYDKIKKASIVPEYIRAVYDADDDSDKLLIDMCLPALRVIFYAATHEPRLFSDLMEKMIEAPKLPPFFHRKMLYKESFQCLCLLGDECLECLLSELDCSDQVYNGLHSSVIKRDFDAFEIVMQEWNGSFSKITPICRLLYLEILLNESVDQIMQRAKKIGEIQDPDQQEREANTLLSNVFNAFLMIVKDVLRNEPEGLYVANKIENVSNGFYDLDKQPNINDEIYEFFKEGYQNGVLPANPNVKVEIVEKTPENFFYKMLLIAYDFLANETSISPSAIKVIKETLYTPEYKAIWKQYEDSGSIDFILDEIEPIAITPQIEEPASEDSQPERLSAADYEQTFFPTHNSFEQETTMKDVPLYPDSKYGFIPEDYFNQKIDNAHPDDHYELVDEIIDEGEEMFVGFVNYIAKHQYIENDNKTKALFAYRLSGRIRPNEEDIRAIPWWTPNKSPKELLYIIRYCVDKGSHKKFSVQMTDFFEGPDWPTEGYSTMADEADTNFRKALHAMYAVCGLKYTKPKKKKKW